MNRFLDQLRAFHDGLDPSRRRVFYAAVALSLAAILGVGVWASQPSQTVLSVPESADELARQTSVLAQAGLPYEVDPVTRAISVPSSVLADARRVTATDPTDVLEPSAFMSPDQEKFQRVLALQKSLQQTINVYDGVASSKVHLNLPESSPFFRDERAATATVMIRPDAGSVPSPKLARTIALAVAHAVTDMSPYDVTVSDTSGRELWPGEMGAGGEGGDLAGSAARRETELSRGLLTSLSVILGSAEDLTVSVSVELETATRQSTVRQLDPTSGVATREVIKSETASKGGASTAAGPPGTDSNLPESSTTRSTSSGSSSDQTTTDFDYSKTETTTTLPAGGVKRLSASVMINSAAVARVLGVAEGGTVDEAAAAALKTDIEEATRAALGFDATRGDTVVVKFVPFAELVEEPVAPPSVVAQAEPFLPTVAALVAVLALVFGVLRPMLKMVRPAPGSAPLAGEAAGVAVVGPDGKVVAANGQMPDEDGETSVDLMERLRNYIENYQAVTPADLSNLVRREPSHSAEVVRRWIRG